MWLPLHYVLQFNCQPPVNRIDEPLPRDSATNSLSTQGLRGMSERWPNLQELLEGEGAVNIGHVPPDHNAAVALEGRHVHAMLRIGEEESLVEILDRLDSAVATAVDHGISIDEINQ